MEAMRSQSDSFVSEKESQTEKGSDFVAFRNTFINQFDFETVSKLASSSNIMKTGSRTVTWKMFLGMIPTTNDTDQWLTSISELRVKFQDLHEKYFKLNNRVKSDNPLATLMSNEVQFTFNFKDCPEQALTANQKDKLLRQQIHKDTLRTQQEMPFFKEQTTKDNLNELLYIWANENPEFSYQQGFNEILASIVMAFNSEARVVSVVDSESEEDYETEERRIFEKMHDQEFIWSDSYWAFDRVMNLGLMELYYRDTCTNLGGPKRVAYPQDPRERKRLEFQQAINDKQKTYLKQRANLIFTTYLKKVDQELYSFLVQYDLHPEMILLRWLRVMLVREFKGRQILPVWDHLLSTISEETRFRLQQNEKCKDFDEAHSSLKQLDYLCVALLVSYKPSIFGKDYIEVLTTMQKPNNANLKSLLEIASRVKKVCAKQKSPLLMQNKYPIDVTQEVTNFMSNHDLRKSNSVCLNNGGMFSPVFSENGDQRDYFSVEEDPEGEIEDEQSQVIQNTNMEMAQSQTEEEYNNIASQLDQSKLSISQSQISNKIVMPTKGGVFTDKVTQKRRYMTPLEQFLNEQQDIFKKNIELQSDDQGSCTITTAISANIQSNSSMIQEDISPKQKTGHLQSMNALNKMANVIQFENRISEAEQKVLDERARNIRKLKSIRGYLTGLKTVRA